MPLYYQEDAPELARYPASLHSAAAALWNDGHISPSARRLANALVKQVGGSRK